MKWTGLNELREMFLSFFEEKGHTRLPSYPLVPQGDNSLLLINSGMAPMKKFFLGQETPPNVRVTTCQKCIRTPDIEQVGKTARHGTYFEMLGNFSFGDYFKHEATKWAWEFITERLEIPKDRLWVTIYLDDDEAFDIWTKEVGIPPERIVRLGKDDNFWEIGAGPCGPCSEIYFDRGEKFGCGSPDCGPGCECDRYMEFWNLVFSQFVNDGEGNYTEMEHKNIDTGMGLERLACIMQGVDNLFEVDTVQNIMQHISRIAGIAYHQGTPEQDVSLRVVTDHIRSTVFMVADGVVPQNEGRGYVLRRLLRRAARHGRLLGIKEAFLYKVCDTVIDENLSAYPELEGKRGYIKKVIQNEEARFEKTIDQGMEMLSELIDKMDAAAIEAGKAILPGDDAFKLYDTYGFPVDLVREIIAERQIALDQDRFDELMDQQRARARAAREDMGDVAWVEDVTATLDLPATEFVGYGRDEATAKVLCIIENGEIVDQVGQGQQAILILDQTPFYAESGGQVADRGAVSGAGLSALVTGCQKSATGGYFLHHIQVQEGVIATGDSLHCAIDNDYRQAVARNHTAAHLLQAALRQVLGDHVHQAGQLVDSHRVRFDFSHFSAMSGKEIMQVEEIVNRKIMSAIPTDISEMSQQAARDLGAMALFGEKYGDVVRVCRVGDFSMELCGGTHVQNTGCIGLFKILSESSAAAGIRRIEAVTGTGVIRFIGEQTQQIRDTAHTLKLQNTAELVHKAESVMAELKEAGRKIEELSSKLAAIEAEGLFDKAIQVGPVKVITASFTGTDAGALRTMGEKAREGKDDLVVVLSTVVGEKGTICVACGKSAVAAGLHAGKLIKEIAKLAGGSGGGRPDSAMAGVKEIFKIDEAMAATPDLIRDMLA
ncbi:Alanine--tRNA ligase [Anaerotruncus sp. 2789STDY5834896]|uniref:Alanine--tRNA ligase n=1 Tax=uncultured Anaerotruncus sp. TaxID=905011 RepID=A0A1C6HCA7_9FIRM|nr:Alanine--tRNA ligase [uncultured Anaerotruncus sp.]